MRRPIRAPMITIRSFSLDMGILRWEVNVQLPCSHSMINKQLFKLETLPLDK